MVDEFIGLSIPSEEFGEMNPEKLSEITTIGGAIALTLNMCAESGLLKTLTPDEYREVFKTILLEAWRLHQLS